MGDIMTPIYPFFIAFIIDLCAILYNGDSW